MFVIDTTTTVSQWRFAYHHHRRRRLPTITKAAGRVHQCRRSASWHIRSSLMESADVLQLNDGKTCTAHMKNMRLMTTEPALRQLPGDLHRLDSSTSSSSSCGVDRRPGTAWRRTIIRPAAVIIRLIATPCTHKTSKITKQT